MKAGAPAKMSKADWNSAHKHQAVRGEDHKLQVFEFGWRLFEELMMVFGAVSAAGILILQRSFMTWLSYCKN